MTGAADPLYVLARKVLLDALSALDAHLHALVLVGAQAVYVHTGDAELAVAEYTTDGDLAVSPSDLAGQPLFSELLTEPDWRLGDQPGRWTSREGVYVDLLVPEALAGPGSRGARLGPHGNKAARRAKGLEGALVDRNRHVITALDPADRRALEIWVAGPAALLVAKTHKIAERAGSPARERDKDALDVLRLLRGVPTGELADGLETLRSSELAALVTREALERLPDLFGDRSSEGVAMAVRAAGDSEDPEVIAASVVALTSELLDELLDRRKPL